MRTSFKICESQAISGIYIFSAFILLLMSTLSEMILISDKVNYPEFRILGKMGIEMQSAP